MHAVIRGSESVDQRRSDEIVADDAIRECVERLSRPEHGQSGRGGAARQAPRRYVSPPIHPA